MKMHIFCSKVRTSYSNVLIKFRTQHSFAILIVDEARRRERNIMHAVYALEYFRFLAEKICVSIS